MATSHVLLLGGDVLRIILRLCSIPALMPLRLSCQYFAQLLNNPNFWATYLCESTKESEKDVKSLLRKVKLSIAHAAYLIEQAATMRQPHRIRLQQLTTKHLPTHVNSCSMFIAMGQGYYEPLNRYLGYSLRFQLFPLLVFREFCSNFEQHLAPVFHVNEEYVLAAHVMKNLPAAVLSQHLKTAYLALLERYEKRQLAYRECEIMVPTEVQNFPEVLLPRTITNFVKLMRGKMEILAKDKVLRNERNLQKYFGYLVAKYDASDLVLEMLKSDYNRNVEYVLRYVEPKSRIGKLLKGIGFIALHKIFDYMLQRFSTPLLVMMLKACKAQPPKNLTTIVEERPILYWLLRKTFPTLQPASGVAKLKKADDPHDGHHHHHSIYIDSDSGYSE